MPVVEKSTGGRVYLAAIDEHVTQGDRIDVPQGMVEYLCDERGDFERLGVTDVDYEEVDDSDANEDDSESEAFDADEFVNRTPMDSVIEDIHAGDIDDHLDAVQDAAERVGVQDAVGERRAALAEEE